MPIIKGVFNYNFTNEEIAQQLTLLDFEIFQKIGVSILILSFKIMKIFN